MSAESVNRVESTAGHTLGAQELGQRNERKVDPPATCAYVGCTSPRRLDRFKPTEYIIFETNDLITIEGFLILGLP